MCSIGAILGIESDINSYRKRAQEMSRLMRHRGPDWTGIYNNDKAVIAHERLAIVDVLSGAQPLIDEVNDHILAVNGEIYNHKELEKHIDKAYKFKTKSDCEVILPLYQEQGEGFVDKLRGMFAFVLYDASENSWLIARDHMGIIPLYWGWDERGYTYVASELKALVSFCKKIEEFPPGSIYSSKTGELVKYYKRDWMEYEEVKNIEKNDEELERQMIDSVRCHLMSDVPYGLLISGGLDSSVISAIAKRFSKQRVEDNLISEAWWPRIHSFSIGLKNSPDLIAARKVADSIGTVHHELVYTIQEGLDAIDDVIYHVETYDVTTIRASTPMYLMARKIRAMGIKMVLSGEGADEIFGGYLYFHMAPDKKEFHEETVRKVMALNKYDCLRANKSMAAWGVETRVPFLDKKFMDYAMHIDPAEKMSKGRIEKKILRDAFRDYLPAEIINRQKEQFSDGVGYSWIDSLKANADESVSDEQMKKAAYRYPYNTPDTKEAYFYREIFEKHFPGDAAAACVPGGKSVACSTEKALEWSEELKNNIDPSGRAVKGVHNDGY